MLAIALFIAASAASPADEAPIKFHIPEGWVDLSPGAPEENFARVSGTLAEMARKREFAALALEAPGRSSASLVAKIQGSPFTISRATLPALVLAVELGGRATGTKLTVIESSVRRFGDVDVARLITDPESKGTPVRQVVYLMPAGGRGIALTYTADRAHFAERVAAFDAAAARTEGLRASTSASVVQMEAVQIGIGVVALLIFGVVLLVQRMRKKKA